MANSRHFKVEFTIASYIVLCAGQPPSCATTWANFKAVTPSCCSNKQNIKQGKQQAKKMHVRRFININSF